MTPHATRIPAKLILSALAAASLTLAGVTVVLRLPPDYFLASRAFTVLYAAFAAVLGARFFWNRRHTLLIPVPWWVSAPAGAVFLTVAIASACYLNLPFWLPAELTAYCEKSGGAGDACRESRPDGAFAAKSLTPLRAADGRVPVYVISHGWHTSLSFPTKDVMRLAAADWNAGEEFFEAPWFDVGWGSAEFFQADEITAGITARALFIPLPSVLHVAKLRDSPERVFQESPIVRLDLPDDDFRQLVKHVSATVALDASGRPRTTGKGDYGPASRFIAANGDYYFPETCNVWTARGLAAAGVPVTPTAAITSNNLMFQTARLGERIR